MTLHIIFKNIFIKINENIKTRLYIYIYMKVVLKHHCSKT